MQFYQTIKSYYLALVAIVILAMTAQTAWAQDTEWPSYITNVVLVGGTESEAQSAKSGYSGYTWCSKSLNDGTSGDVIYIGYKTGNSANTNGGYITDFVVVETGSSHNPSSTFSLNGKTYSLCPYAGGNTFANDRHGNLTSQVPKAKNMYLYYTKANFSDKRAVSGITITTGSSESAASKSGAINCYNTNGNLFESEIDLNKGAGCGTYVYMHLSTETKVNRPYPEPTTISGLTYDGTSHQLIPSNYDSDYSGDVYFRLGTTGSYTDVVNSITATNAGTYTIYYYSGESYYGNSSVDYAHTISATIAKSPNSAPYVTCSNILESSTVAPELKGTNLSTGTVTYKYSTSQNGEYTPTKPTTAGTYWVKATITADSNCEEYTTAATSFNIIYDWRKHNTGDTEDDAYVISTIADLKYLAIWVNAGNSYFNKYFKLGANITLNKNTTNNFTPIGTESHPFSGTFDGKGYTISGLNINKPSNDYIGLFGYANGATIKNLTLTNSTITGKEKVGGITGIAGSTKIANCLVTNSVNVSGDYYAGGVSGMSGQISGCNSAANVSATSSYAGGIVGYINGQYSNSVDHCLYTGNNVTGNSKGAIVGSTFNPSSATLTANYYTQATIGGCNGSDTDGARKAVVINAADGVTVTPTGDATAYNVSGITGYSGNSSIKYTVGYSTVTYAGATENVGLDIAYNIEGFSVTGYTDGNGNALTHVSGNTYPLTMTANAPTVTPVGSDVWGITTDGRDGSAEHPYLITTTEGLDLLAKKVNGIDGYSANTYSGKYFELGNDITYSYASLGEGESNYTAIGTKGHNFMGKFDGKGHTISGIRINANADNQGLFGYIYYAEVKNLTIDDTHITIGSANKCAGAIAGYGTIGGLIENCHTTNSVIVSGGNDVGGIAGDNQIIIRGCTSAATVSGNNGVGGLVGYIVSTDIVDCLVLGATISGNENVGVFAGEIYDPGYENSYYIGTSVNGAAGSNAYELPVATYAMGTKGTTYAADTDYEGITAYQNGLAYNGKYYSQDPWGGRGTEYDPYVIYNTAGMDKLASNVNGGNRYENTYFVLGADITYDKTVENNYMPIGNGNNSFFGTFDGKGHTISGINVNLPDNFVGLFGSCMDGYIKNLTVANSTFTGKLLVAAIAAFGAPTASVENCVVASDVTVSGNQTVGGIVGEGMTVNGCISAATVSGTSYVGGIVGINGSSVGYNGGTVSNCLYLGTSVTGTESVGAIAGLNWTDATLTNNYHTLSGKGGVGSGGSAIGSDEYGAFLAVSSTTKPSGFGEVTTTYGKDDYIGITAYQYGLCYNGQYYEKDPNVVIWSGKGTYDNPYVIRTTAELDQLASRVNSVNDYDGKYFALGADITYDKTKENNYTPIGNGSSFYGTFDGQGHIISGIRISDPYSSNKAIFGRVERTVKNLVVSDCRFEANQIIGGIVAYLRGTIENCHVLSDVTLSGNSYVGGIVAQNDGGTIKGCTSAATITGIEDGWNAKYHGGIVSSIPYSGGTPVLTDNLFTGTISGNLGEYIGAIVGMNNCDKTILNNNYHTCSGMGGVGNEDDATSSDVDGATIAYELPEANAAMGEPGSTYAEGTDYEGITVFENGLVYNGQFYSQDPWGGYGTEEDPYVIYTPEGLDQLASRVNSGNDYDGKYFALGADITYDKTALTLDLDGEEGPDSNFPGIGDEIHVFYASLDGRGHTISGIVINRPNYQDVGLFGYAMGEYIKNLTLANSAITGEYYVGAIVGFGNTNIENCHVTSDVTVSGQFCVGGIVGIYATIQGCTSAATVSGSESIGGILGNGNGSTVRDCLYLGNSVTATSNSYVGAIVGGGDGNMENNYHTYYGHGGIGSIGSDTGDDVVGALFAVTSANKPDAIIGDPTAVYGEDDYIGITAYSPNGLYYNNCYYWLGDVEEIDLEDDGINEEIIVENDGKIVNVLLAGRTFRKDGKWSTIVLPFDVDLTAPDCPLQGAIIRTLPYNNINNVISGTTLNLTFGEKWREIDKDNILMAGQSYLIRWNRPDDYEGNESMYDIVDPLFIGVKIKDKHLPGLSHDGLVSFDGNCNYMGNVVDSFAEVFDVLLLGDDNNLHYATPGESLGACRACFVIHLDMIDNSNFRLTNYIFDLGNGEMLSGTFPSIVQPVEPGDANGDGNISVTDIAVVVNCILQLDNNGGFSPYGADANGDGQITVTDIGVIVDKILGVNNNSGNATSRRLLLQEVEPQ